MHVRARRYSWILVCLLLMFLELSCSKGAGTTKPNQQPPTTPTRIVYTKSRDVNDEIYVINSDGTAQTRLTNNPASDRCPTWSPDSTKIAFASDRDSVGSGNYEIYVMNVDGTNPTRLTNNPALDFAPAWSPDGTKIAFHSNRAST